MYISTYDVFTYVKTVHINIFVYNIHKCIHQSINIYIYLWKYTSTATHELLTLVQPLNIHKIASISAKVPPYLHKRVPIYPLKSSVCARKSPINPQKNPHTSTTEPAYVDKRLPYMCERALCIRKRAPYIGKRAL